MNRYLPPPPPADAGFDDWAPDSQTSLVVTWHEIPDYPPNLMMHCQLSANIDDGFDMEIDNPVYAIAALTGAAMQIAIAAGIEPDDPNGFEVMQRFADGSARVAFSTLPTEETAGTTSLPPWWHEDPPPPIVRCPTCGQQLHGDIAARGACLGCFPTLPEGGLPR